MNHRLLFYCGLGIAALWAIRILISDDQVLRYGFIVWNVMLAAVPVLLEPLFRRLRGWRRSFRRLGQVLLGASWLMFLPNTFYVLTDFMHLNATVLVNQRGDGNHYAIRYARGDTLYMYDSLLLFLAVLLSAYLGGAALVHAYGWLSRRWNNRLAAAALVILGVLVGIGVYIGRFARWNSWDGLYQPWNVVIDLWHNLGSATNRERFFVLMLTMLIFQGVSFIAVQRLERLQAKAARH